MNPPLLSMTALSAEESQLQSAAVMFRGTTRQLIGQVSMLSKIDWRQALPRSPRHWSCSDQWSTAHPDTVITTPMYLQRTLNSFGMQHTHLAVDMSGPMERASVLDERHTSPGYDTCSHEFPGLYRNTDETIWRGHSHRCSVCWHHQHSQW